jgi:hypothetical protein
LLGDHEARLLEQPWRQIDETPAHDAMDGRDRAVLRGLPQRLALGLDLLAIDERNLENDAPKANSPA